MWIVYVIQNDFTKELYFGRTNNLKRRLWEHNHHRQLATSRKNGQWQLIYAEAYRNKQDAINRELRLKNHGSGKHELKKRIKKSLLGN